MSSNYQSGVAEVFDSCAKQYEEKFLDDDRYNSIYYLFCDLVKKKNPKVLEIGCGPGNTIRSVLKIRPDFEVLGIDLSPKMIELAKKNNPASNFKRLDAREINTLDEKFDVVICSFCLPYLNKQEALSLISDIADIMQPGGLLYISTMEDDYNNSGLRPPSGGAGKEVYVYYHEASYLINALEQNNFKIYHHQKLEYLSTSNEVTKDLIIISTKLLGA